MVFFLIPINSPTLQTSTGCSIIQFYSITIYPKSVSVQEVGRAQSHRLPSFQTPRGRPGLWFWPHRFKWFPQPPFRFNNFLKWLTGKYVYYQFIIKDITQKQPNRRDAKGKEWERGMKPSCPLCRACHPPSTGMCSPTWNLSKLSCVGFLWSLHY